LLYRQSAGQLTAEKQFIRGCEGNMPLRSMHMEGGSLEPHQPNVCHAPRLYLRVEGLIAVWLGFVIDQGLAGNIVPIRKTLARVNIFGGEECLQD
jgi:hypothetical protein